MPRVMVVLALPAALVVADEGERVPSPVVMENQTPTPMAGPVLAFSVLKWPWLLIITSAVE